MKLWDYQELALSKIKAKSKALLCLEQRMGKTPIACRWALIKGGKVLVVCPAALQIAWRRELDIWAKGIDAEIVSYDSLHKIDDIPDTMILDECHRMKNPKAKRTKLASHLIRCSKNTLALSGTPIPNKPIEIWPILFSLGITKMSYHSFGLTFCNGWRTPWKTWDFSGSSNEDKLRSLIDSHSVVMKRDQIGDFRQKEFKVIPIDMKVSKLEKQFNLKDLEGAVSPTSFVGLSEILREQGEMKAPKCIPYIKDRLSENESVILFAHHKSVVEILESKLSEYGVSKVIGGMTPKKVAEAVDRFQDGTNKIFIGNIIAASEGLTLPKADRVIMIEASWVPGVIAQATDRGVYRGGGVMPIDIMTVHKSIDEYMLYRALEKMETVNRIIKENTKMVKNDISKLLEQVAQAAQAHADAMSAIAKYLKNSEGVETPKEETPLPKAEEKVGEKPKAEPKATKPKAEPKATKPKAEPKAEEEPTLTIADVRPHMKACFDAIGSEGTKEVLKSFDGAVGLTQIPKERFGEVIEAFKKAVAEHE